MACNQWPCCCSRTRQCVSCDDNILSEEYEYVILFRFRTEVSEIDEYTALGYLQKPTFRFSNPEQYLSLTINDSSLPIPEMGEPVEQFVASSDLRPGNFNTYHCAWGLYYTNENILTSFQSQVNCPCVASIAFDPSKIPVDNFYRESNHLAINPGEGLIDSFSPYLTFYSIPSFIYYNYDSVVDMYYVPENTDPYGYSSFRQKNLSKAFAGSYLLQNPKLKSYQISKNIFTQNNNDLRLQFSSSPFNFDDSIISAQVSGVPPTVPNRAAVRADYIVFRFRNGVLECVPNKATISTKISSSDIDFLWKFKTPNFSLSYPIGSGYFDSPHKYFHQYPMADFPKRSFYSLHDSNYINGGYYQHFYEQDDFLLSCSEGSTYVRGSNFAINTNYTKIFYVNNVDHFFGTGGRSNVDLCVEDRAITSSGKLCYDNYPEQIFLTVNNNCVGQFSFPLLKNKKILDKLPSNYGESPYVLYTTCPSGTIFQQGGSEYAVYANVRFQYSSANSYPFVGTNRVISIPDNCWYPHGNASANYLLFKKLNYESYEPYYTEDFLQHIGPAPSAFLPSPPYAISSGEQELFTVSRYERNGQRAIPQFFGSGQILPKTDLSDSWKVGDIYSQPHNYSLSDAKESFSRFVIVEEGSVDFYETSFNTPFYNFPGSETSPVAQDQGYSCSPFSLGPAIAIQERDFPVFTGWRVDRFELSSSGTKVAFREYDASNNQVEVEYTKYTDKVYGTPHYWMNRIYCDGSGYMVSRGMVTVTE